MGMSGSIRAKGENNSSSAPLWSHLSLRLCPRLISPLPIGCIKTHRWTDSDWKWPVSLSGCDQLPSPPSPRTLSHFDSPCALNCCMNPDAALSFPTYCSPGSVLRVLCPTNRLLCPPPLTHTHTKLVWTTLERALIPDRYHLPIGSHAAKRATGEKEGQTREKGMCESEKEQLAFNALTDCRRFVFILYFQRDARKWFLSTVHLSALEKYRQGSQRNSALGVSLSTERPIIILHALSNSVKWENY